VRASAPRRTVLSGKKKDLLKKKEMSAMVDSVPKKPLLKATLSIHHPISRGKGERDSYMKMCTERPGLLHLARTNEKLLKTGTCGG